MFEKTKLEIKRKQLEKVKAEIIKEKEELEAIKRILDSKCEKIDISNTYVFFYGEIYYLVNLESNDKVHYDVRDIFNKQIIFKIISRATNEREIFMKASENFNGIDEYAYVNPILEENHELLRYVDRQVPSYVLQQYLYKLNNIYIDNSNSKKLKK